MSRRAYGSKRAQMRPGSHPASALPALPDEDLGWEIDAVVPGDLALPNDLATPGDSDLPGAWPEPGVDLAWPEPGVELPTDFESDDSSTLCAPRPGCADDGSAVGAREAEISDSFPWPGPARPKSLTCTAGCRAAGCLALEGDEALLQTYQGDIAEGLLKAKCPEEFQFAKTRDAMMQALSD